MSGPRFPGGLKLDPRKIASEGELRELPMPARLHVPLLQHLGEPARPCVALGERVLKGQRIGDAVGLLSANIHAPTSGHVRSIESRDIGHASGQPLPCIELEADGADEWQRLPAWPQWRDRTPAALIQRLRDAGVVGLGGGVFPTDVKLSAPDEPVHTLIVNGAECEPYIACDDALLRAQADDVVAGASLLGYVLSAQRVLLAIEDGMPEAIAATTDAIARLGDDATVATVPTRYPQGGERQLIHVLTGIDVSATILPRQRGVVCINVGTAAAAWRAVVSGEPVIDRLVSVTGPGVRSPQTFRTPIGTSIAALVEAAGGYTDCAERLVLGGPMMGIAVAHDDIPIGKSVNCVLALSADEVRATGPELPCIRCGECARVCPATLLPQQLNFHIAAGNWIGVRAFGLSDCIECGLCAYVCPSQIPLVDSFRYGKGEVAWQDCERQRADVSRHRHERRQSRLAQAAEARATRLAERQSAPISVGPSAAAAVAAAMAKARARGGPDRDEGPVR